jgi:hypothetical protein
MGYPVNSNANSINYDIPIELDGSCVEIDDVSLEDEINKLKEAIKTALTEAEKAKNTENIDI